MAPVIRSSAEPEGMDKQIEASWYCQVDPGHSSNATLPPFCCEKRMKDQRPPRLKDPSD